MSVMRGEDQIVLRMAQPGTRDNTGNEEGCVEFFDNYLENYRGRVAVSF